MAGTEKEGILIDPGSDRRKLTRLRDEAGVRAVWLSHWHEDHITHLDLFDDLPIFISEPDAPMLSDMDTFLDGYGVEGEEQRRFWRDFIVEQFHFRSRTPEGFFTDKQLIQLDEVTVRVHHTPGHTPGHMAFHFIEPEVLFLGDYDLTKFGPWYGDRDSSLPATMTSIRKLRDIEASVWITGHETGVFEENPGHLWEDYLNVAQHRENRLIEFLETPRTLEEIVNAWIVYRKPREPREFYEFAEKAIICKHLESLKSNSIAFEKGGIWALT